MQYDLDRNSHSVYSLNYHFVQCVKYRRKAFYFPEIIEELKSRTMSISISHDINILSIETDLDHVHILFKTKPQTNLTKFINNWKSATSKVLRRKFKQHLKDKLWADAFWSESYCLITTGQTTLEVLRKYVENQGEKQK
jgi:putative transposase